jgi:hypothetical protein
MKSRLLRGAPWFPSALLVVLLARWLGYAVSPSPAARLLEHRAGGPGLPAIALVSLTLAAAVAVTICWLAALGIRERALLERRLLTAPPPRFRVGRTLAQALALGVCASLAGGLLEAYLHWRAGLGWHGLHCLLGPVHRNLIPFEFAFSFIAAAALAAAKHVAAWMRRTFALLRSVPAARRQRVASAPVQVLHVPRMILCPGAGTPRAPPALS